MSFPAEFSRMIDFSVLVVVLVLFFGTGWLFYPKRRVCSYFEVIDLDFVPKRIKNYLQDSMFVKWRVAFRAGLFDKQIMDKIVEICKKTGVKSIIGIGAGGGGIEPFVVKLLAEKGVHVTAVLTDLAPNAVGWKKIQQEFGPSVQYIDKSVNALAMPSDLKGLRMCAATIHHFPPHLVKGVLEDAVKCNQPIILLDGMPSFHGLVLLPIKSFLMNLNCSVYYFFTCLSVPTFQGKLKALCAQLPRFALTFTGILPLIQAHDMFASVLRFYGEEDMRRIVSQVKDADKFDWEFRFDYSLLAAVVGIPKTIK